MGIDLNNVSMVGRATRDAEMKNVNGKSICSFSIAVNGWSDAVSFFNCTIFGKTADNVGKFITKGKQLGLVGELKQERWEQDGQKRTAVKIIVNKVQLLGSTGPSAKETEAAFSKTKSDQFDDGLAF